MATTIETAIANVEKIQHDVDTYLAVPVLNDHQRKDLRTDLKTLSRNLDDLKAALAAPGAVVAPIVAGQLVEPVGLTNWGAAQIDAGFVLNEAIGNLVGADTNPAPDAARILGFSGVVGTSTDNGTVYGTFTNGVLSAFGPKNPGDSPDGYTVPFSLAAGIDNDAQYTGPGTVRP